MIKNDLTNRQTEILSFLKSYAERYNLPPTIREISNEFAISPTTAFRHLKVLKRKGEIRQANRGSRSFEVDPWKEKDSLKVVRVPILGRVSAGVPLLTEENFEGFLIIEKFLFQQTPLFGLRIRGDSMTGAGILNGDYVIAVSQPQAENGDIVIACLYNEFTVKRLRFKNKKWWLTPENSRYKSIVLDTETLQIQGKVVGVQRIIK